MNFRRRNDVNPAESSA